MTRVEISQDWIDSMFYEKFGELAARVTSKDYSDYNLISIAGLMRDLVYDTPLYERVNKLYKIRIRYWQFLHPNWTDKKPEQEIPEFYTPYVRRTLAVPDEQDGKWYTYSVSNYMNRPLHCFVIDSKTVKPRQIIRLYANVLGGRHLDGFAEGEDIEALHQDNFIMINGIRNLGGALIDRVGRDTIYALAPLRDAVEARLASLGIITIDA